MSSLQNAVEETLKTVNYPGFSRDIVSFGLVKGIQCEGSTVTVNVAISTQDPKIPTLIKEDIEQKLNALEGVETARVQMAVTRPSTPSPSQQHNAPEGLQDVRFAIAVASGKGGVGKSTVAVNLACALDKQLREAGRAKGVGIMDCDIYGPSVPLMLGVNHQPEISGEMIEPVENFGIKVMSMGLLVDEDTPVVWRGPMIQKTIQQFAMNVNWGSLEILVVDLPPGTGDAQLSLVQTIPLDGAVIVTTPQPAAVNVARRGAKMFEKVSVPILGVAENMSYLLTADGSRQAMFGEGGGEIAAKDLDTELLTQIPLDQSLREGGDRGIPIVLGDPESTCTEAFNELAKKILKKLG